MPSECSTTFINCCNHRLDRTGCWTRHSLLDSPQTSIWLWSASRLHFQKIHRQIRRLDRCYVMTLNNIGLCRLLPFIRTYNYISLSGIACHAFRAFGWMQLNKEGKTSWSLLLRTCRSAWTSQWLGNFWTIVQQLPALLHCNARGFLAAGLVESESPLQNFMLADSGEFSPGASLAWLRKDVQNASVALVLSISTYPWSSGCCSCRYGYQSKLCFELFCREAFEVAEIGLLHHLGWCNADVFAVGTIFCENLFDQCLLFGHWAFHLALKIRWSLFWSAKKKPLPKAGVLKVQRECVLVSTTWAFLLTNLI